MVSIQIVLLVIAVLFLLLGIFKKGRELGMLYLIVGGTSLGYFLGSLLVMLFTK